MAGVALPMFCKSLDLSFVQCY